MVTTRRSISVRSPPATESPRQRIYPDLEAEPGEESSNEDEEDDHEESSTTHPDAAKYSSNSSFNSSSSSFNTSSHEERNFNFLYCFLALFLVCLVYWLLSGRGLTPVEPSRSEFGKRMGPVLKKYPQFSERDRAQLRSAFDRWFDSSTKDPVVVIIYAPDSSLFLDDLTTSTASALGRKTTVVTSTASTARSDLHSTFENTLKGGSKSTIGLREIEKLRWDTPLVLHAFADSDHIAASRPLIWLQVTRDDSLKGHSCDAAIERTLTSSWLASGGNEDNVAPVISRVLQFTVCLDW